MTAKKMQRLEDSHCLHSPPLYSAPTTISEVNWNFLLSVTTNNVWRIEHTYLIISRGKFQSCKTMLPTQWWQKIVGASKPHETREFEWATNTFCLSDTDPTWKSDGSEIKQRVTGGPKYLHWQHGSLISHIFHNVANCIAWNTIRSKSILWSKYIVGLRLHQPVTRHYLFQTDRPTTQTKGLSTDNSISHIIYSPTGSENSNCKGTSYWFNSWQSSFRKALGFT
jgi:hypothetical protein